ncbi:MAG: HAMP domain-containing sensor histidine kinase [Patescibacteria group bacterium]
MIYLEKLGRRTREFRSSLRRLFGVKDTPPYISRFAEFGRGASGVIHDLSNPLTVISLSMEQLKNDVRIRGRDAQKHIETALRASRKMKLFLSTAKQQLAEKEIRTRFDVIEEIQSVIKLLRPISKKSDIKIKYRSHKAVFIFGDEIKFFRIVSNIVSNAIDSYVLFPGQQNKLIIIRVKNDKKNLIISIRDFGCGIPKHLHKAIFEPFYTTKQKHEGTAGLGLSIVKNIVENDFKCKIKIDSTTGRGSTFKIIMLLL